MCVLCHSRRLLILDMFNNLLYHAECKKSRFERNGTVTPGLFSMFFY